MVQPAGLLQNNVFLVKVLILVLVVHMVFGVKFQHHVLVLKMVNGLLVLLVHNLKYVLKVVLQLNVFVMKMVVGVLLLVLV